MLFRIKEAVKSLANSRSSTGRAIYKALKAPYHFWKLLANAAYRAELLTKWKYGALYYQRSFETESNRYPVLFRQCQAYLNGVDNPHILSFGCSTGEEAFTIGEYLPTAQITGVDINKWCIEQCKKKYKDKRFSFFHALSAEFIAAANFDAIFCLAVFQRTENRTDTKDVSQGLTFAQFEQGILMLDKKLKPNGLLIIDHAGFSFADTACASHYAPLDFPKNKIERDRPLFGTDNKKIADEQNSYRVFVKAN